MEDFSLENLLDLLYFLFRVINLEFYKYFHIQNNKVRKILNRNSGKKICKIITLFKTKFY